MESHEQASGSRVPASGFEKPRSCTPESDTATTGADAAVSRPPTERPETRGLAAGQLERPDVCLSETSEVLLLRGKLAKQSTLVRKLVDANRSWEQYCQAQSDEHDGRLREMAAKVEDLERSLAERGANEERLRLALDRQTVAAKQEQLAAEDVNATLLAQLTSLQQSREALTDELGEAMQTSEVRCRAGIDADGEVVRGRQQVAPPAAIPPAENLDDCQVEGVMQLTTVRQEVADEMEALKLQISTLEEDFANERADKERELQRAASARQLCEKLTSDNLRLEQKLSAAERDLVRVRKERQLLKKAAQRQQQALANSRQFGAENGAGVPQTKTGVPPAVSGGHRPIEQSSHTLCDRHSSACVGFSYPMGPAAAASAAAIIFSSNCVVVTAHGA